MTSGTKGVPPCSTPSFTSVCVDAVDNGESRLQTAVGQLFMVISRHASGRAAVASGLDLLPYLAVKHGEYNHRVPRMSYHRSGPLTTPPSRRAPLHEVYICGIAEPRRL